MDADNEVKPIRKLEQLVINRIAAGEIIHRPASALKEMIENCLDANATNIQITAKEGGLKLLQIQDNGHGIRKDDLDIVCERFTTSKLNDFSDLQTITTYGFRGEALASISHVAHLTITTRTANSKCAFQLAYSDGKPKGSPKPCAGNQGTLILVEDLFYNVSIRRKTFQSPATEYSKIAEVVGRYAIHNAGVGFSLKKQAGNVSDIKTPMNSNALDNIKIIFGADVSRDLLEVCCEKEELKFKMRGYISSLNCNCKKTVLLLFINHRLVESSAVKKTVDTIYSAYLHKQKFPFVYLSLEIDAQNVDVNVHPTKQEVLFLHETDIIIEMQQTIERRLFTTGQTRTLYLQTLLPMASDPSSPNVQDSRDSIKSNNVYDHQLVRTDCRAQKLDAFLLKPTIDQNKSIEDSLPVNDSDDDKMNNEQSETIPSDINSSIASVRLKSSHRTPIENRKTTFVNVIKQNEVHLTSVLNLKRDIEIACVQDLRDILRDYTFVGCVNPDYTLAQHQTKLYLLNTHELSQQLFYQIMIYDFGNYSTFQLSEPAQIYELVTLALDSPDNLAGWDESMGPKDKLARYVADFLPTKAAMLQDLFAMEIDQNGNLLAFPYLLENYTPALEGLPMYLLRLATEVNWDNEVECFKSFCLETSRFYAFSKENCEQPFNKEKQENGTDKDESILNELPIPSTPANSTSSPTNWQWTVEHILFPAFRDGLQPAKENAINGNILLIAVLSELYKVFERC